MEQSPADAESRSKLVQLKIWFTEVAGTLGGIYLKADEPETLLSSGG